MLIGLLGFGGSATVGLFIGIPEPYVHDEFSYLLAADTFAHGRLTNPTHPMWAHFESLHIIHTPTYMSKYPPAQGLVLAVGQVISGKAIVGVWMSVGLMCAAICWMLYAWVPASWALLGGFLAVIHPNLGITGYWAQSYFGGAVAATGGALVAGGLRRIMRRPRIRHALLIAIGLAVLANSRPYEGLLFSLPAGAVLLRWMISRNGPTLGASTRLIVLPIFVVLAITGMGMGLYNSHVTGSIFRMPYMVYEETYSRAPIFLWQKPRPAPIYRHEIFRQYDEDMLDSFYTKQRSISGFLSGKKETFRKLLDVYLGSLFALPLVVMLPIMIPWVLRNRWALFALVTCSMVVLGFIIETVDGMHYVAPITGLIFVSILQAMRLWRWRDRVTGQFVILLIISVSIYSLVRFSYHTMKKDHSADWHQQRARIVQNLEQTPGRHLVIVSYGPKHDVHAEWVYNKSDIDAARVVWGRDMSKTENDELLAYFRDRQVWQLNVDWDDPSPELQPYSRKVR